ncbi:transposase [Streptomyces purpurogeneiscleroticus]|nr:transposase [Streptomyces purpurogeneiscleroticus]
MPLLFTTDQRQQLLSNGRQSAAGADLDPHPAVKLFMPDGAATWLLTEIDPIEPTRAFGLCDAGHGSPELGYVSLLELAALRGRFGLSIERDTHFVADRPLSAYAADARAAGRIRV